jgi:hypothetical protein
MPGTTSTRTHEQFIHAVRSAAVAWAFARGTIDEAEAVRLLACKLVYGVGDGRYRGVCHYSAWKADAHAVDVVEIAATGEESLIQVAGTTEHPYCESSSSGFPDKRSSSTSTPSADKR